MKKEFVFVFFLIVLLTTTIAQTEIFVDSAEKEIEQGKTAFYQITILNLAKEEKKFSLSVSEETFANFRIVPVEQKIKADASGIFKVYVEAKKTLGTRRFNVTVSEEGKKIEEKEFTAIIVEPKKRVEEQIKDFFYELAKDASGQIKKAELREPLIMLGVALTIILVFLIFYHAFSSHTYERTRSRLWE